MVIQCLIIPKGARKDSPIDAVEIPNNETNGILVYLLNPSWFMNSQMRPIQV